MTDAAATLATNPSERFSIGSVIADTFRLIGRNFARLAIIATLTNVVPAVIYGALNFKLYESAQNPALLRNLMVSGLFSNFWLMFPAWLLGIVCFTYFEASVSSIVISQKQGTARPNVLSGLWRHLLPLLGILLLTAIAAVVGTIFLVVPGIIVLLALSVAAPARVGESLGVFESLRRSWILTSGFRWRIFLIYLALYIMVAIVNWALFLVRGGFHASFAIWAVSIGPILAAAANVIFLTSMAVVYCELRKAKEGGSAAEVAAAFS